jgi:hypothetical protein
LFTIIKTKVEKRGELSSYILKPITSRITSGIELLGEINFKDKETAIGVITEAIELDDCYELTIHIWDRFIIKMFSFQEDQLDSMMFSIARR